MTVVFKHSSNHIYFRAYDFDQSLSTGWESIDNALLWWTPSNPSLMQTMIKQYRGPTSSNPSPHNRPYCVLELPSLVDLRSQLLNLAPEFLL